MEDTNNKSIEDTLTIIIAQNEHALQPNKQDNDVQPQYEEALKESNINYVSI